MLNAEFTAESPGYTKQGKVAMRKVKAANKMLAEYSTSYPFTLQSGEERKERGGFTNDITTSSISTNTPIYSLASSDS